MKCPSLEQIYDMDLDNLLLLKENIDKNKIVFNSIPLNEEEDDYDLYYDNSPNDKESILNLINSEIKERESTKELLNFFNNLNFNFENNIENKFLAELNAKTPSYDINKNIFETKNKENISQNKNLFLNNNKKEQNLVKIPKVEDLRSFLNRTKVDPNKFQYKVSSNTFVDKFWSIDKEKKLRKKKSNLSNMSSNMTTTSSKVNINNKKSGLIKGNRSRIFSEKIVIGAIDIKKDAAKKKIKKKKKFKENNEVKIINTLELRRNYKVSDVKQFLKKKTSLKPLDLPKNQNKDKNCFNNDSNSLNIKIFNKKQIIENNNINKEPSINEESKIPENNKINYEIKNDSNFSKEELNKPLILNKFYFFFKKGIYGGIKYEELKVPVDIDKLKKGEDSLKNFNKFNDDINIKIINNNSFNLTGKIIKDIEKPSHEKIIKIEDNYNLKEEQENNNKNINFKQKDKLIDNKNLNNNELINEKIINHEPNNESNQKLPNLNEVKENEKNNINNNAEALKEERQFEELEEEEEEEIEEKNCNLKEN